MAAKVAEMAVAATEVAVRAAATAAATVAGSAREECGCAANAYVANAGEANASAAPQLCRIDGTADCVDTVQPALTEATTTEYAVAVDAGGGAGGGVGEEEEKAVVGVWHQIIGTTRRLRRLRHMAIRVAAVAGTFC